MHPMEWMHLDATGTQEHGRSMSRSCNPGILVSGASTLVDHHDTLGGTHHSGRILQWYLP